MRLWVLLALLLPYSGEARLVALYRFESVLTSTINPPQVATTSGTATYVTYAACTFDGGTTGIRADAAADNGQVNFPLTTINSTWQVGFYARTSATAANQMLHWIGSNSYANDRTQEVHIFTNGWFMYTAGANQCVAVTPTVVSFTDYYVMHRGNAEKTELWVANYNPATNVATNKILVCTGPTATLTTLTQNKHGTSFNNADDWLGEGVDNFAFWDQWDENWPPPASLTSGEDCVPGGGIPCD